MQHTIEKSSILVTCPPMMRSMDRFIGRFEELGLSPFCPDITQTLSESQLVVEVPKHRGWIIGDDVASKRVFAAGVAGDLRAAVKWGVGVDNVDLEGARSLGLDIANTPGMFSDEVADLAMCFVTALARDAFALSNGVFAGAWPKPVGMSLKGKVVALLGYGNIGRETASRLLAAKMKINVYDPGVTDPSNAPENLEFKSWPAAIDSADFIVITCSLNSSTRHIINADLISQCKPGVRIVNVSRGPLIDEVALASALEDGQVAAAALEVFETEPLPADSRLREFSNCIFGSHNASNTQDAVDRTSIMAIDLLQQRLLGSNVAS